MNKILTIIVSYNFEPWIERCLQSLRQSSTPVDVVVIDNASHDDTVRRIRDSYSWVELIESERNLGFGRANNIGMEVAIRRGYEAVLLLNQDAWVAPGTIEALSDLSNRHPEYGILSPTHLTGKGDKPDPGFSRYIRHLSSDKNEELRDIPFVNAACWFIPRRTLQVVGGFSPLFYHYGEDKDYINRLVFHRLKIGYLPHVTICHDREYRPYEYARFMRTEMVYHLSEYANINYCVIKAFALGPLACLKKALIHTLRGKKKGIDYFKMTVSLIGQTCSILAVRRQTKQATHNFLKTATP